MTGLNVLPKQLYLTLVTQSNDLFVVSADTKGNRFSTINTMENAVRADFVDPDRLIILWP